MHFSLRGLLAATSLCVALGAPAIAQADYQPIRGTDFFSPTGVWNKPLSSSAPIASYSATYVNTLNQSVATAGTWITQTNFSVPVYTVPANQPTVLVTLQNIASADGHTLQALFQSVPIPPDARPADGTDQELVVWQPSTQTLWEFWGLQRQLDGSWQARWGGKMPNVNTNPGYYPAPFGGTASGLSQVGGLMTLQEESDGVINHALALSVPNTLAGVFLAPAQQTDGKTNNWSAIPEGMRFRLPANLNIDALHLPRQTAMMAKAVQRYGMIVRDTSSNVTFYAEDPYQYIQKYHIDPYGPYAFQNQYPNQLLAVFPWKNLQVVTSSPELPLRGHAPPARLGDSVLGAVRGRVSSPATKLKRLP